MSGTCCHHNGRRHGRRRRDTDENIAAAVAAETAVSSRHCRCRGNEETETENIITDRFYCCASPGSIPEELYSGVRNDTLIKTCYDSSGRSYHDARRRCTYWPSFARPRWLNCEELFNKDME